MDNKQLVTLITKSTSQSTVNTLFASMFSEVLLNVLVDNLRPKISDDDWFENRKEILEQLICEILEDIREEKEGDSK